MRKLLILSLAFLMLNSCSFIGYKTLKGVSSVPKGTRVDYEKVINSAFARDYIGADIITQVEFYAMGKPNGFQVKVPKDHIIFQVVPIGREVTKKGPFGGVEMGEFVFVPKEQEELIFKLKRGDRIEMRGGTRVREAWVGSVEFIEFMATSVRRL